MQSNSSSIIRRWVCGSLLITVLVLVLAEGLFLYYSYNDLYGGVERAVENRFSTVVGRLQATGTAGDMAVTAEYQGKRVLCILTGALRITHPYGDDPNSYSVVDYWGNYEETEKLLNIAFG